ncbi:MAG: sugar kinase [Pseudomonadota bacterium]
MKRLSERKIVLVHRETRLDGLVRRHNTREQARFYVESRGDHFEEYEQEDRLLKISLEAIATVLKGMGRVQLLEREFLPNFLFGPEDIIVVAGQDGLVANTLKYLNGQPLLAVNPAPSLFDGQLLPFQVGDVEEVISAVLRNDIQCKSVTMAEAKLNDGQRLLAVNDVYIGPRLPVSARYEIACGGKHEVQSSSGVLVSTGLGSTGWLRSVLTGASAIAGGRLHQEIREQGLAWDSDELVFSVREPFPSNVTSVDMAFGKIGKHEALTLTSRMAEGGVIFSDGIVADAIEFNSGVAVEIALAERVGRLVI